MSKLRWLLAVALAIAAVPGQSLAQATGTVTGRVTDPQQQPVGGAQIVVVGGTGRAVTGQDGTYRLTGVRPGSVQVSATRIGFDTRTQTVSVAAGATATADFTLSSSALELGGLVVTATGREQRQREMGNAVSSINVADVELASVNNMANLLQGRSAGVVVAGSSGTVGTAQRIRIRGSNSISLSNEPLVVIDGVRIAATDAFTNIPLWQSPSRLNDINPEDIETVEVLKGPAAAALYGTAAANGVIQITTKRGRAGKARWTFYSEQGMSQDPTNYPTSVRSTTGCWLWDVAEGACDAAQVSRDSLKMFNPLEDPSTTPFQNGSRQQYGLSVSGGSDAVTYYVSGDWEGENGVYQMDGVDLNTLDRLNLRANLTSRVSDKLNLTLKSGYTTSDLRLPDNDNSLYGILLNGLLGSGDPEEAGGTYGIPFSETFAFETGQEARRFTGSMNANYRPLGWLSVVGNLGLDQVNRHDHDFVGANEVSDLYSSLIRLGYRRSNRVEVTNLTGTLDGTATFSLLDNLVSTTSVGTQYTREEYHDNRAFGRGVAPGTKSLNGVASLFSVGENNVENATLGTYGQQQLAWNDRLFVTAALRGDENSAFGTDAGFAWYPSLSTSWVVSEEPFFPALGFVDNLRLRAAYGKSGLRPSFRDALTFYEPTAVRLSGTESAAVTLGGTGNPNLRPEVATEVELGFDLGLLNERIGLEFTYYDKRSVDALVERRLAPSLGLTTTTWDNVGEVSNRGIEGALNARLADLRNLQWELTLTASRNENELVELGEGIEPILMGSNRVQQRHTEGYALGGYWLRPVTYADANGDGLLQTAEVTIGDEPVYMGQPIPTKEASLNTSVTLFNLVRLSGMLDYKGGHKQMNFTRFDRCSWEVVCPASFLPEESNFKDQAGIISFWEQDVTSVYLEKADFVKLRELAVSLSAPDRLASRFGLGGLRLTLSGRNLKTWTDYSGFDPEVNSYGVFDQGFQTYDYYTQPPLRYYTARIDVNF